MHTGSTYSNAKYPFEFPRQPLSPNPTQQTNENEWPNMKAGFKCIMWAFIFSFSCLFMSFTGSPVIIFLTKSTRKLGNLNAVWRVVTGLTRLWRGSLSWSLLRRLLQTQSSNLSSIPLIFPQTMPLDSWLRHLYTLKISLINFHYIRWPAWFILAEAYGCSVLDKTQFVRNKVERIHF